MILRPLARSRSSCSNQQGCSVPAASGGGQRDAVRYLLRDAVAVGVFGTVFQLVARGVGVGLNRR